MHPDQYPTSIAPASPSGQQFKNNLEHQKMDNTANDSLAVLTEADALSAVDTIIEAWHRALRRLQHR
jgi:hypothetical protein